jgi:hypothetical protein
MGVLANLRFARQRARKRPTRSCGHLDQIQEVTPSSTGCQPCLELGDTWVHGPVVLEDTMQDVLAVLDAAGATGRVAAS